MVSLMVLGIRLIRRRAYYHQEQEVFWPLRCCHCARAVGAPGHEGCSRETRERSPILFEPEGPRQQRTESDFEQNRTGEPAISRSSANLLPHHECQTSALSLQSNENASNSNVCETDRFSPLDRSVPRTPQDTLAEVDDSLLSTYQKSICLYSKPHRSLLKLFCLLGIASIVYKILIVIGDMVCLGHGEMDMVLVVQCLEGFVSASVLSVALIVAVRYNDAVFVQSLKFCYVHGIAVAAGVWIGSTKISNLIHADYNYPYYELKRHCKMNGTLEWFIPKDEIFQTFFSECGIIAAGIAWQMWSNTVPVTSLQRADGNPSFERCPKSQEEPTTQRVLNILRGCSCWTRSCLNGQTIDRQLLLGYNLTYKALKKELLKYFIIVVVICVMYYTLRLYLDFESFEERENMRTYVSW